LIFEAADWRGSGEKHFLSSFYEGAFFMFEPFKYYGLDWMAMILSVAAMILLGNKIKWGFVLFLFANVTWIVLAVLILNSWAIAIGNLIFLATNLRGFIKWNKPTTD
jgi:hypothetical protein